MGWLDYACLIGSSKLANRLVARAHLRESAASGCLASLIAYLCCLLLAGLLKDSSVCLDCAADINALGGASC